MNKSSQFIHYFTGTNSHSISDSINLLHLQPDQVVTMEQVHGTKIAHISKYSSYIPKVDACYTQLKNIFLSVKSADCLPILIWGSTNKNNSKLNTDFVAAAHAGRKGTQEKILYKLLQKLNNRYQLSKDSALSFWFGPAICFDCYQIDKKTNLHFDLVKKNKKQLFSFFKENNLDTKVNLNLKIENHCTLHENEKFHSYRATGLGVKMNYSFIGIN